jgi:hypothetical protein
MDSDFESAAEWTTDIDNLGNVRQVDKNRREKSPKNNSSAIFSAVRGQKESKRVKAKK